MLIALYKTHLINGDYNYFIFNYFMSLKDIVLAITSGIALCYILTLVTDHSKFLEVEQVIDCWHGEQIATPNVQFKAEFEASDNFCLVIPIHERR